jgi:hypothetical protein
MGGPGSGNNYHWWRPTKKEVVEVCLRLDAGRWGRKGVLRPGLIGSGNCSWSYADGRRADITYQVNTVAEDRPAVWLTYSRRRGDGPAEALSYRVGLTTTRPNFGGLRWWFLCPLLRRDVPCGRRVGKLYLPPAGRYFGCRRCHGLTYTSCQESGKYRGLARFLAQDMGISTDEAAKVIRDLGQRGW